MLLPGRNQPLFVIRIEHLAAARIAADVTCQRCKLVRIQVKNHQVMGIRIELITEIAQGFAVLRPGLPHDRIIIVEGIYGGSNRLGGIQDQELIMGSVSAFQRHVDRHMLFVRRPRQVGCSYFIGQ